MSVGTQTEVSSISSQQTSAHFGLTNYKNGVSMLVDSILVHPFDSLLNTDHRVLRKSDFESLERLFE